MSSKTPKENGKWIKWGHELPGAIVLAIVVTALVIFTAIYFFNNKPAPESSGNKISNSQTCNGLHDVNNRCISFENADTNAKRLKGLSDRGSLAQDKAMLFTFDQVAEQCIWMKDMRFNIDIVWLDESKKISQIKTNAEPSTYPESFCTPGTKYVIELNAGASEQLNLKAGQQLAF
jgi:uncharacterized membrane protein (UPF0127 family)